MKKFTLLLVLAAALAFTSSYAATQYRPLPSALASAGTSNDDQSGFYVFGDFGYGTMDRGHYTIVSQHSGFALNAGAGYQFNRYVAIEVGYLRLPEIKLYEKLNPFPTRFLPVNGNFYYLGSGTTGVVTGHADFNAVDFLIKLMLPVDKHLDLFVKTGAAWVYVQDEAKLGIYGSHIYNLHNFSVTHLSSLSFESKSHFSQVAPVVGFGMDIHMTQNLSLTLEELTVLKAGDTDTKSVPFTIMGLAGLSYKI